MQRCRCEACELRRFHVQPRQADGLRRPLCRQAAHIAQVVVAVWLHQSTQRRPAEAPPSHPVPSPAASQTCLRAGAGRRQQAQSTLQRRAV